MLFLDTLFVMEKTEDLKKMNFTLIGFAGKTIYLLRAINLLVVLGKGWMILKTKVIFIAVDAPNSYNTIMCRTTLNPNKIIITTCHKNMKFPTPQKTLPDCLG